ncbi:carboxymuconolactone decarboxylase family protein [Sphingobium phenoxybenzoativorans]|jgi:4-carboxymuconolactone decarboxylase|uniref:Carboxymuconolactone decarboxylase family protein n=1 Tax=Sphingobium phenoxybenzoativorans TaxID=1592790 RepID=A0A975KBG8_9SPHN|nr:carboxymuconolactone decarboxylase family protein [Sphingobium phenoxybenzoativorans]QUT07849.1 carboxymuconolactone decarboxylase family protein [Sphingobium phenoxybenzoativorans]
MSTQLEIGRKNLREIIGDEYFEKRVNSTNDFNRPVREFSDEICFGDVWARPGLDRKTRSLLVIAILTALNRAPELKLHVQGGINNGASVQEIQEVLYQCIVYCGLPAGVGAFKVAEEALSELGKI